MNIDWAIAVFLFIIFIGWSFIYVSGIDMHSTRTNYMGEADKVMDMVSVDIYRVPVIYNSSYDGKAVLYAVMDWRDGNRNSTKVYYMGNALECMIADDMVVWEADIVKGKNEFIIEYSNNEGPPNCTAVFSGTYNETTAGTREWKRKISIEKMNSIINSDYEAVKDRIGMKADFRIEANIGNEGLSYGPVPPANEDVHSIEREFPVADKALTANVRILLWQ